ncbi:prominin 1 b isoform X6 [Gymnodraco acuticeps]|uniref:Prominin 1 b isoform X6 n=1 Tax=Gymnodraco acuticeps TaxID=8218 RepID=A0A6P8WIT3_GYMAC|nr:prominin 1 b isoform X6 [Gymnodraco acuticeps]
MLWTSWLVLLLCWGATTSGEQQAEERDGTPVEARAEPQRQRSPPPVEPLDFGFVPAAVYDTHAYFEPGPIGLLFHMVHAFLYVVQPNTFPKDLIIKVIQQNMGGIKIEEWRKPDNVVLLLQTIYYEAGFLICATIGILFVVLVPIIALCFCVCRCCDNCGGEMHQRQRKNVDCQRGFYTALLVATSIFMSLGVFIAYAANHNVSAQIKNTRRLINTNMRDLKTFANNTPTQIEYMTAQYTTAKNKVLSDLDNIGPLLGGRIHSQLEREVVPSLDNALRMAGAMRETKEALENVSSSLEVLQEGTAKLQASLSGERASLSNTLSDPACTNGAVSSTCNTIRSTLAQLGINSDYSKLPDVNHALVNVNTVLRTDLSNIVQKGYSSFNDTPQLVKEQTKNIVSGVKGMLDKIGIEINGFSKMFPVEASLTNFTVFLTQGQKNIESFYPQIDQMDFYRWVSCVAVLCMVVLVLAFNTLGLLCGVCGYDEQVTPTTRGCLSNTGGNLLMAGVGFSFISVWVLMAIVSTLFVIGGNVEKMVCEPLANRQLFKIIDTPFLVHPAKKNFLPGMLFQNPNIELTLGGMYRDCYENNGLYHSLQLETMFNINSFLNRTVYNKDLAKVLEGVQVDLQDVTLLEQAGRDNLINFANSGIGHINYEAYLTELNKGVTISDLLSFSTDLEAQADQLPRGALENALKGHASSIRQIHRDQVVPMEQAMKYVKARSTLSQSIKQLQRMSNDLTVKATNILSAIDAAEYLITHNASHVVKRETKGFTENLVGYFKQYTAWVKHSLSSEVAQCKPISNIVDSMEIIGCSFIVDSVNTFWFGLGGCCVLLIPSIIVSVKLAKYYRRMDTEDVFEDMGNTGNHGEQLCGIHGDLAVVSISPYPNTLTRFPRASAPPSYADWEGSP